MSRDPAKVSILAQARMEGWREGWAQAGQVKHDDAFYEGQQSAWKDAPSRLRWFLFGLAAGATMFALAFL